MAKTINLSDDAGSTWATLPGSEGSFSVDVDAIDDTILGQSYASTETGLGTWSVSSNGIYKGFPGYKCQIKSVDTSTAMSNEAMSLVAGTTATYEIDDFANKSVWDRTATFTFDDTGTIPDTSIESIDYLFGRVTLTAPAGGAVTVDGNYFTTAILGKANSYTLTMTAEQIDESHFDAVQNNNFVRIFAPGLRTVNLELGGIFDASASFKTQVRDGTEVIIEVNPSGAASGNSIARGYFKPGTTSQSGSVGALEEESITYNLTVPVESNDNNVSYPFNWRHDTGSDMPTGVQIAVDAWIDELKTTEVQYLPQGSTGQSPLDGIEGPVIFSDISLSGGLSNMNVYNVEMVSAGGFTVV